MNDAKRYNINNLEHDCELRVHRNNFLNLKFRGSAVTGSVYVSIKTWIYQCIIRSYLKFIRNFWHRNIPCTMNEENMRSQYNLYLA